MRLMCRQCGYDAKPIVGDMSTPYTCPECGLNARAVRWRRTRSLKWMLFCVIVLDVLAACVLVTPFVPQRDSLFIFFFVGAIVPVWIVAIGDSLPDAQVGCSRAGITVIGGWTFGLVVLIVIAFVKR
jgi:hypothetical protein